MNLRKRKQGARPFVPPRSTDLDSISNALIAEVESAERRLRQAERFHRQVETAARDRPPVAEKSEPIWERSIGSLFGYRRFRVDELGRIRPWHDFKFIFTPRENVARCLPYGSDPMSAMVRSLRISASTNGSQPHRAPAIGCNCGFYARSVYDRAVFDETFNEPKGLLGVIEGYGRAEIGTKGFRCEKAVIREVWLPGRKEWMRPRLTALYPDLTVHTSIASLVENHPAFGMDEPLNDLPDDFWTRP